MKRSLIIMLLLAIFLPATHSYAAGKSKSKKVLIFTKTAAFRHDNIEKGVEVLHRILAAEGIQTFHTEDANVFLSDSLKNFKAVIFFSTTGDIFNDQQKVAFQKYMESGKGFMGIHAATDTEYNWAWYGNLVGAYFMSHPAVQEGKLDVVDSKHPSTKHLPKVWMHRDEWYDFKDVKPGIHILMTLDESSYKDGRMGKFHPIAWYQKFNGYRMFYTGLGHTKESFDEPDFQKHLIGGLKYVMGK